jgi:hypothetical protein
MGHGSRDDGKSRERLPVGGLDEDLHRATTREPGRECIVVRDAVGLQHRLPGRDDLLRDREHRSLDASACEAPDDFARVCSPHICQAIKDNSPEYPKEDCLTMPITPVASKTDLATRVPAGSEGSSLMTPIWGCDTCRHVLHLRRA